MKLLLQLKLKSKMRNRLSGYSATELVDFELCQHSCRKHRAQRISVYVQQDYLKIKTKKHAAGTERSLIKADTLRHDEE